jgi:hypothetical protein
MSNRSTFAGFFAAAAAAAGFFAGASAPNVGNAAATQTDKTQRRTARVDMVKVNSDAGK